MFQDEFGNTYPATQHEEIYIHEIIDESDEEQEIFGIPETIDDLPF